MLFCPSCRSLLRRTTVGRRVETKCPQCHPDDPRETLRGFGGASATQDRSRSPSRSRPRTATSAPPRATSRPATSTARAAAPRPKPVDVSAKRPQELPPDVQRFFPYATIRPGQVELVLDAHEAVRHGRHLLANAPTGTGKTVSSLAAAVAVARETGKRVFFLTSKQSQHRIAVDTLRALKAASGEPLVVADLIAKRSMCPRREAEMLPSRAFLEFCRREVVTKQCDHYQRALTTDQGKKLLARDIMHVEDAVRTLDRVTVCPHQATMDVAAEADVVVCDYNLLFSDMRAGVQDRLQMDLTDVVLVVDEAHNLADRIRDHLSLDLSGMLMEDVKSELEVVNEVHLRRLVDLVADALRVLVDEVVDRDEEEALVTKERFIEAVDDELARAPGLLQGTDYAGLLEGIRRAATAYEKAEQVPPNGLSRFQQFLEMWRIERRGLLRVLTRDMMGDWVLAYKILDPSILAKPVFDQVHASIVMSGTLHPAEAARDVLGLEPARTTIGLYRSPFARENRLILCDTTVTTQYKERGVAMYERIADHLVAAAEQVPGHVAAFFPSYSLMESVRHHLDTRMEVVVEERELDKKQKEALVETLRQATRPVLLLGVQGGSLSEGYDYEDNLLKCVAIVGLPLPPPTLEMDALIAYYKQKFGAKGHAYAYVYPAMNRVLQAAGRLIRSPDDRGVVLLFDKRFTWGTYRQCYPPDFRPAETKEPSGAVRRFFVGYA